MYFVASVSSVDRGAFGIGEHELPFEDALYFYGLGHADFLTDEDERKALEPYGVTFENKREPAEMIDKAKQSKPPTGGKPSGVYKSKATSTKG